MHKYYDKNKKISTLHQIEKDGGYVFIDGGVVLKKIEDDAIIFNDNMLYAESPIQGIIVIKSDKENVNKKLERIPEKRWNSIGYKVVKDGFIKIGKFGKKEYNINFIQNYIQLKDVQILEVVLKQTSKDLEVADSLVDIKDDVNNIIKPSEFISKYLLDEFEKGKIYVSDGLGVILDLRSKKNNISASNVFDSIYYYSEQNIAKLNDILEQLGITGIDEPAIYYVYNVNDNNKIEFRKDGVYYIKTTGDSEVEQIILDKPLNLIGWYKTNYDVHSQTFADTIKKYYEFEGEIIFSYYENADKFNKRLGSTGYRMMVTGKTYQLFYSALDSWIEKYNIKEKEVVIFNGIDLNRKIFTHGGEIIFNEHGKEYKIVAPKYATNIGQQITLEQAKDILNGYTKNNIQYIVLLWFIGAFLKGEFFKHGIYSPSLQVTGFYKSGKTELVQLIMELMGYSMNPIKKGNITLQPRTMLIRGSRAHAIQKKLGDYAPLFCDEYTGKIKDEVDELLKGLYNETDTEKGNADQSVNIYKLLAPVVLCGEASTKNNALMSRGVYIQTSRENRANFETYSRIKNTIKGKCVLEDIFNKVKDVDLSKYKDRFNNKDREEKNYEWLRIVNDIIGGLFTDQELESLIGELLSKQKKILDGRDEMKSFFNSVLVIGKKEQNISVVINKNEDVILDLYIPEDLRDKNHAILGVKELVGDEEWDMENININVSKLLKDKKPGTEWIVKSLFRHLNNYRNKTWQTFIYEYIL